MEGKAVTYWKTEVKKKGNGKCSLFTLSWENFLPVMKVQAFMFVLGKNTALKGGVKEQ